MFEYMNNGALFVLSVVFIIPLFFEKTRDPFVTTLGVICIALLFMDAHDSYSTAQENKTYFKRGTALKCLSGGGLYSEANRYRVSKKNGWSLEGDYFTKDSLMIRANKCERL